MGVLRWKCDDSEILMKNGRWQQIQPKKINKTVGFLHWCGDRGGGGDGDAATTISSHTLKNVPKKLTHI